MSILKIILKQLYLKCFDARKTNKMTRIPENKCLTVIFAKNLKKWQNQSNLGTFWKRQNDRFCENF